jgi:hypothetical protein
MKKAAAFALLIRRLTDQALDAQNHYIELGLMGRDTFEAEREYNLALENLGLILTVKNSVYGITTAWAMPEWAVQKGEAA